MYALIDCNNFYASCERLFRPDLRDKPIVILSNNDGCVIARSNEAKALGVTMGEPYFKVKALCQQHHVQVFSSNYTLYGNLSDRVMSLIEKNWPHTEIYSIDEAFLDLTTLAPEAIFPFCENLQKLILKGTGIPVSIGIGGTKTLAKAANHIAKKKLKIPVFALLDSYPIWLAKLAVNDIWGVGRRWSKKLEALGVFTAQELAALSPSYVKTKFGVVLQRTVMELQGIACLELEGDAPKQSIVSSCSFGTPQTEPEALNAAVSHHCATAWAKMRKHQLVTHHLSVFVRSNPFRSDLRQYANTMGHCLIQPTDDVRSLIHTAKQCLQKIFKTGIHYNKCGVLLAELTPKNPSQMDLFHQPCEEDLLQTDKLMDVIDSINNKYGARTIRIAAEGFQKSWSMKRHLKSPNYTTRWSELPVVYLK